MSLDKRDRQILNSIVSDINSVINEIENVKNDIKFEYRTVGGTKFEKPFNKLVEKLEKARGTLNRLD